MDRLERVASKQPEWRVLPLQDKIQLLESMLDILSNLSMEQIVQLLGVPDATMMGFDVSTDEGRLEAVSASMIYVVIIKGVLNRFKEAYQYHIKDLTSPTLETRETNGQIVVKTVPVIQADKFGPNASNVGEVWLQKEADLKSFDLDYFLNASNDKSVMVVLGAGNHCFLSVVDCLNGLFHENTVVYLKHHPLRNHGDVILRVFMEPLIVKGYFDSEVDSGFGRSKQVIYHPLVTRVHLTGGKATHDAIVWGSDTRKTKPVLQAEMTSELGCVTPWITVNQTWTEKQLDHQVKHLFASLYSNAGANCNSPKVIVMNKDWPHKGQFLDKLKEEMSSTPLPSAYYPGSKQRWDKFRKAYPDAEEYGDDSPKAMKERLLLENSTILPWLLIDGISVDLTTEEGRQAAANEFAFRNEPFAPVVTVAYVDNLDAAVTLCNDYLFGSLSCTVIAPEKTPQVKNAIANLHYGAISVNVWSALCYFSTGGTWGAYPGDTLDNVESGTGQIQNHFFVRNIEKTVLWSNMVDVSHPMRKGVKRATKEAMAVGNFTLKPSVYGFCNLLSTSIFGVELPPRPVCIGITVGAIGYATHKLWMTRDK